MSVFARGRLVGAVHPGVQLFVTALCVTWVSAAKDALEATVLTAFLCLSCYSTALSFLNAVATLPDAAPKAPPDPSGAQE